MSTAVLQDIKVAYPADFDFTIHGYDADDKPNYVASYNILLLLLKSLDFTSFWFIRPGFEEIGLPLDDGNWTGLVGMILRGEADTSYVSMEIRHEFPIDYTFPVFYERVTFSTQKPRPIQKNLIIFQPFSGGVWILFVLSAVTFLLLFCAMSKGDKKCVRTFFYTLGNCLGQPFSAPLTTASHVILFTGWIITITILIFSFKATLLSFLLAVPTTMVSTIDELAAAITEGSVKCRTYYEDTLMYKLRRSKIESHRIVANDLYENSKDPEPEDMYVDPKSDQRTCFVAMESDLQENKNMFVSEDSFSAFILGFPLPKKFQLKKVIDKTLKRMFETGLIAKFNSDYHFKVDISSKRYDFFKQSHKDVDDDQKRIKLEDFKGAFLALGVGLILAFLAFIGEIVFFKMSRR